MPGASTPAGPPVSRPGETFGLASDGTDRVATCLHHFVEALFASGWYRTPPACTLLCLRFTALVRLRSQTPSRNRRSASGARLDRGGWL